MRAFANILTVVIIFFATVTTTHATPPSVSYSGGDGSSLAKAIIITAPDEKSGVEAEYAYIAQHFGKYQDVIQAMSQEKNRSFDIITFTTADQQKHALYFDITSFYGKGFVSR